MKELEGLPGQLAALEAGRGLRRRPRSGRPVGGPGSGTRPEVAQQSGPCRAPGPSGRRRGPVQPPGGAQAAGAVQARLEALEAAAVRFRRAPVVGPAGCWRLCRPASRLRRRPAGDSAGHRVVGPVAVLGLPARFRLRGGRGWVPQGTELSPGCRFQALPALRGSRRPRVGFRNHRLSAAAVRRLCLPVSEALEAAAGEVPLGTELSARLQALRGCWPVTGPKLPDRLGRWSLPCSIPDL